MPKIPTYDQLGQRVKAPTTQIGLQADQSFVSSALATSAAFQKVGDVAYQFGMKEKAENTKAAFNEIKAQYNNEVNDFIRNDDSTSTTEAETKLKDFNSKFEKNYARKGLTPNQIKSIRTDMILHQGNKMQVGKNLAFDRGRDYNSTLHKNASNNLVIEISKLPIGNPLRNAMEQELRETINTANENGETANLDYKTFEQASNAIKVNDYNLLSGNSNTIEEIAELKNNLKNEPFDLETNLKLNSLLDAEEKRVENEYADGLASNIFLSNDKAYTNDAEFEKELQKLKKGGLVVITNEKGVTFNIDPSKLPVRILESVKAKAETRRNELLSKEINDISNNLSVEVQGMSLSQLTAIRDNIDKKGADRYKPEIESFASRETMKQIINAEIKGKAKRAIADSLTVIDDITSDLRGDGVIKKENKKKIDEVFNTFNLAEQYQKANEFKLAVNAEIKASGAFQSIKFNSKQATVDKLNELKLNWDKSGKKEDELVYNSFKAQVSVRDSEIKKDFIGYYKSQNPKEEITISKMLSIQAEMDIPAMERRVTSNAQLDAFEAEFNETGIPYNQKAKIGNDFIQSFGAHQNKVLRHLINTGKITTVDNLLLAYPNDVRIKGAITANTAENIKLNKDSIVGVPKADRETVSSEMSTLFSDYSISIVGGGFDDVLSGGFTKGRANHIQNLRSIAINTANYYLREGLVSDPKEASTRAYNEVVGNHNTFVQVNETPVRFGVEFEPVAKSLGDILETSIVYNVDYLKETIEAPPAPLGLDDAAKSQWQERYYTDLTSRGTWRTTTDGTGVYMVDQLGNMVKRKDSGTMPGVPSGMSPFITVSFENLALTLDKYNEIESGAGMIIAKKRKLIDHFKTTGQLF
mgnify:FL=1